MALASANVSKQSLKTNNFKHCKCNKNKTTFNFSQS